jgi:hypothetical protein
MQEHRFDKTAPRLNLCTTVLCAGADVGAIQYIPANEQLEVFPEGTFFNLDTVSCFPGYST